MSSSYRADHVGSLLRPQDLLDARRAHLPSEELEVLEDRHIRRVMNKQQELGLSVFTDGELRRSNFMSDFTDAVDGFDAGDAVPRSWSDNAQKTTAPAPAVSSIGGVVTSPLKQREPLTGREVPFLLQHSPGPDQDHFAQCYSVSPPYRSSMALQIPRTGIHTHCSTQSLRSWCRT